MPGQLVADAPRRAAPEARGRRCLSDHDYHPRRRRDLRALVRHHPRRGRPGALLRRRGRGRGAHDPCLRPGRGGRAHRVRARASSPPRAAALAARRADPVRRRDGGARHHPRAAAGQATTVICTLRDPRVPALAAQARHHALGRRARAVARPARRRGGRHRQRADRAVPSARDARAGAPKPAAIIGMPVGFVGAAESKEALAANRAACRSDRARPHRRQRHDGGRGQRAGEGRAMSAAAPDRRRRRARRSGAADAEGRARARRGRRGRAFRQGRQRQQRARASPRRICGRRRGAAAALSGDDRDRQGATPPIAMRCAVSTTARPRRSPRHLDAGRTVARDLPRAIRCSTAPTCISCAARAALSDRGRPRRHRHVRLLVGGRHADRPGRRRVHRAARHAAGGRAGAPARRHRRRRGHEGRPQPRQGAPRARARRPARRAPSMSSAAPWPKRVDDAARPRSATTSRRISPSCWCRAGRGGRERAARRVGLGPGDAR